MKEILFLDDSEKRIEAAEDNLSDAGNLTIVRTSQEAISQLNQNKEWYIVLLDHDLGGVTYQDSRDPGSGMEVVRWIMENKPSIEIVIIHSWNAPAAEVMVHRLQSVGYFVIRWPFNRKELDDMGREGMG